VTHLSRAAKIRVRRLTGIAGLVAAIWLSLAGCAKTTSDFKGQTEDGVASWYGHPFDGRATASGEIFDMEKNTAAHRTLPFGSVVRVESLVNHRTVEVRINDRGPFVRGRIIDLSHGAAGAIQMPGVANVRLLVLQQPATRGIEQFTVQSGAFSSQAEADRLRGDLEQRYGAARLVFRGGDQTWRVLVGQPSNLESATGLAQQVDKDAGPAFVVRSDPEP